MFVAIVKLTAGIILVLFVVHYILYIIRSLVLVNSADMQSSDDTKFIKKRWKGGIIEPHPTEKALIVNYKLEAAVVDAPGDVMLKDKKDCQRIIRLRNLNSKTDSATLAREVLEKCDLIHKSQLTEVEQVIYYLKNRKDAIGTTIGGDNHSHSHNHIQSGRDKIPTGEMTEEKASIRNIDDYVELLYEELADRIHGSALILQLARNPDNLEELEKNESVLSALSRVLREDWKKSIDLSTNIIYTFFCFSTYTNFHHVIVSHKIGSLCMEVIDYELKRYEQIRADIQMRKNGENRDSTENVPGTDILREERPRDMEPPRRRIPELKQRPKSGNWSSYHEKGSVLVGTRSMNSSYHDNLSDVLSTNKSNESIDKEDYEKLNRQQKILAKKQDQLLRVAFYLLLNMAENIKLEDKMRKKSIVKMLIKSLDRQNVDLLVLVVTFLKKLSIVRDNKDEMYQFGLVEKLMNLLSNTHSDLIQATLKLLFNLSFDANLRSKMIRVGCLPKLVAFLSDEKHHSNITKILYHMSLDDKVKSIFTYTECIPLVTDMLLLNLNAKSDTDLVALCINLSLNKRNAHIMIEHSRLNNLMARAFKYEDVLLLKLIRNISTHVSLKKYLIEFVGDLAQILDACENEEFLVECIGILGNLSLPDLDYSQILHNFNLIPFLRNMLVPGKHSDDLILECIILLGTCTCDESCAMLLCKADIILSLIELLKAKQEDDEIVLQIVFVFQEILKNESTRQYMIKETESTAYLIDLMQDKNAEIRKICDNCLDIIALTDCEWAARIKLEKFRNHNIQWLTMVETQRDTEEGYPYKVADEEDIDIYPYMATDYLNEYMLHGDVNGGDTEKKDEVEANSPELEFNEE